MPNPGSKQTIAVDIDEVLARYAESFVEYSNRLWGTQLKPDDSDEHWARLWGIESKQADERAKELYKSDLFRHPAPLDDAEAALRKLSEKYKLVIATSRHRAVTKDTIDWAKEHFGDLFEEIHFAGIWDDMEKDIEDRYKYTKAELCRQIGADYLIDDAVKHCVAAAEAGIKSILFGDYPWNRSAQLVPNMARAKNWHEVLEYFDAAA